MPPTTTFRLQMSLTLVALALAARLPLEAQLTPLIWVHAFRKVGLSLLAPAATGPEVSDTFRAMIAYGDLIAVSASWPFAFGCAARWPWSRARASADSSTQLTILNRTKPNSYSAMDALAFSRPAYPSG